MSYNHRTFGWNTYPWGIPKLGIFWKRLLIENVKDSSRYPTIPAAKTQEREKRKVKLMKETPAAAVRCRESVLIKENILCFRNIKIFWEWWLIHIIITFFVTLVTTIWFLRMTHTPHAHTKQASSPNLSQTLIRNNFEFTWKEYSG